MNQSTSCLRAFVPQSLWLRLCAGAILMALCVSAFAADGPAENKLRIICFGAHPDDCELQAGGVGAMWAAKGHQVKLVSVTNGDVGHWREAGGPLALRRKHEVEQAAKVLGTTAEVLDVHDGELMPTLENRQKIIRLIRQWNADVVMSPRPWDYHPDHRYTSILVQDAAYMVTVPFVCPEVPALKQNPVFLYYTDRFQKPVPSQADIAVSIDSVIDKKLDALGLLESQFLEGGANGHEGLLPKTPEERTARVAQVRAGFDGRYKAIAGRFRQELGQWYGDEQAKAIVHAEAFEICEYGRKPTKDELKKLFPFFEK
ncbi:MAG: PIG-L deacetylase family protein [Tepidisphaerales bacterium]